MDLDAAMRHKCTHLISPARGDILVRTNDVEISDRAQALLEGSLFLMLRLWQWCMEMVYGMKDGILLPVSMTILDC